MINLLFSTLAQKRQFFSSPYGNRTRVSSVKGRCPRPLDERAGYTSSVKEDAKVYKSSIIIKFPEKNHQVMSESA